MPFVRRMQRLVQVAATQQQDSCNLVKIRCERGAYIAKQLGIFRRGGRGHSQSRRALERQGLSRRFAQRSDPHVLRLANLSQTLDVFYAARGAAAAVDAVQRRSGRWFDPELVKAAIALAKDGSLWSGLDSKDLVQQATWLEPQDRRITATEETIDNICQAFAEVIDAKSPFTYRHSNGVADAALEIGRCFGLGARDLKVLRRAALLHDVGKLSVPNPILEKPDKLNDEEWKVVRDHPFYTYEILNRIPGFEDLSSEAAAHHEKLDGSGYWRGWGAEQLSTFSRILAVADIYDALRAKRPYRDSLPLEKVFSIMRADAPRALDLPCLEALIGSKMGSQEFAPEPAVVVTKL